MSLDPSYVWSYLQTVGDFGVSGGMRGNSVESQQLARYDEMMRSGRLIESKFRQIESNPGRYNNSILGDRSVARAARLAGDARFAAGEEGVRTTLVRSLGSAGASMRAAAVLPEVEAAAAAGATSAAEVEAAAVLGGWALPVLGVIAAVAAVGLLAYGIYTLIKPSGAAPAAVEDDKAESVKPVGDPLNPTGASFDYIHRGSFFDPNLMKTIQKYFPVSVCSVFC